jgi:hypothetical protein
MIRPAELPIVVLMVATPHVTRATSAPVYRWRAPNPDELTALHLTIGVAAVISDAARIATWPFGRAARPIGRVTGEWLRPVAERGQLEFSLLSRQADQLASRMFPAVVRYVFAHIDLTALIDENIDLDGLARHVIADIDLPGIIRESSAAVTSEAVRGVRKQGIQVDQGVARVVDRMLLRRRDRAPGQPGPATDEQP